MSRIRLSAWRWVMLLVAVVALASCKPQVPKDIIQPGKMEDILYDWHLARSIGQDDNTADPSQREVKAEALQMAVLRKHGVTKSEFEHSLKYYVRHTERLHDIYEHLADRYKDKMLAMGASAGDVTMGQGSLSGDTTNVWTGSSSTVLTPYEPYTAMSFSLKTDSSFHKGDAVMLNFFSQYIVQDGMRDAIAVLSVRFANDSIATQTQHVMDNFSNSLRIDDNAKLGIKEVKGFIMLTPPSDDESVSTLRLLFLYNIRLLRLHIKPLPQPSAADSINAPGSVAPPLGRPSQPGGSAPQPITGVQ